MWPLSPLPPPPMPRGVTEHLSDYPDLLEELQLALNNVVLKPALSIPPFEVAIWTLKDGLGGIMGDAQGELRKAEAAGDALAAAQAEKKRKAASLARSSAYGMQDLDDLHQYFEENRRALRRAAR
jgi:hypothetical protein